MKTDMQPIREQPEQDDSCYSTTPLMLIPSAQLAEQVRVLSALSDPTRLRVVEMLAELDEPLCVCDIVSQFSLGQPTISHHLKVLRDAGLVVTEKRGLWVYYSLNAQAMDEAASYLARLATQAVHLAAV